MNILNFLNELQTTCEAKIVVYFNFGLFAQSATLFLIDRNVLYTSTQFIEIQGVPLVIAPA